MEVAELKKKCEDWVEEGLDYLSIRKRLKAYSISEEDRISILAYTDELLMEDELYQQARQKSFIKIWLGAILAAIGFLVLMTPVFQVIPTGVIFTGIYIAWQAYKEYQSPKIKSPLTAKKKKSKFDRY